MPRVHVACCRRIVVTRGPGSCTLYRVTLGPSTVTITASWSWTVQEAGTVSRLFSTIRSPSGNDRGALNPSSRRRLTYRTSV